MFFLLIFSFLFFEKKKLTFSNCIKYETYRSTLTAYPNTLLGAMFADHNKPLVQKINENEYFIDRNGHIFYYILEFYRTGKVSFRENFHHQVHHSSAMNRYGFNGFGNGSRGMVESRDSISDHPITYEELEEEMKYFQIPINTIWSSLTQRAIITKIDAFVDILREVFYQVLGEFGSSIEIKFRRNKYQPQVTIPEIEDDTMIFRVITSMLKPYGSVGYLILDKFGREIGHHMGHIIPELKWELQHIANYNWYCVRMSTTEEINHKEVLKNSCLGQTLHMNDDGMDDEDDDIEFIETEAQ